MLTDTLHKKINKRNSFDGNNTIKNSCTYSNINRNSNVE